MQSADVCGADSYVCQSVQRTYTADDITRNCPNCPVTVNTATYGDSLTVSSKLWHPLTPPVLPVTLFRLSAPERVLPSYQHLSSYLAATIIPMLALLSPSSFLPFRRFNHQSLWVSGGGGCLGA